MHRDTVKEGERDLHRLALHSRSGDISFVLSLTDPTLIPALEEREEWAQMGVGVIVSIVHNKGGQITAMSNVDNGLLKALEMEAPY